jgi:hypothetical protein
VRLTAERDPDRDLILRLATALAERGLTETALDLGRWLDSRPEMRGGDLLLLLARAEMARGDHAAADELLTRAEAFELGGDVELTRILLTIVERRWTELPAQVAALRKIRPRMSAKHTAILALLEEQLAVGTTALREGRAARPWDADWQLIGSAAQTLVGAAPTLDEYFGGARYVEQLGALLRGQGERVVDPRELLALLLVIDEAAWVPWCLDQVERLLPERRGGMWRLYLTARVLRARGLDQRADELESELRDTYPHFGPGWDLSEQRLTDKLEGDRFAPQVVYQRRLRAEATAPDDWPRSELDRVLDRAVIMAGEGDAHAALPLVDAAFVEAAEVTDGRQVQARLRAMTGDWAGSLEAWMRYLPNKQSAASPVAPKIVEEVLDVLRRGARDTTRRLSAAIQNRALEELTRRFPLDPRVALARARFEAARTPANPALGVGRALGVLEGFRAQSGRVPLSRLAPGSVAAWVEWLQTRSSSRTEALLIEEIANDPGGIELWLALAETFERTGREAEALSLFLDLCDMAGTPEAHLGAARILARSPARGAEVEKHVLAAERARGGDLGDQGLYLRIRARMTSSGTRLDIVLDKLSDLWDARAQNRRFISPFELGRTWILALVSRRSQLDLERLDRLVRELAEYTRSGIESEWLQSVRGLVAEMDVREAQPANPRRKSRTGGKSDQPPVEDGADDPGE